MISLTLEHILELHALSNGDTGGADGLRDLGRLEAAMATQTQVVFGTELYSTLHEKAAALTRGIISDHAFVDGNKRTGMLVGIAFLQLNDQKFKAQKGELEDFAVKIAIDRLSVAEIATWLESHCK